MQQQIQVLAADQRNIEEQSRQLTQRAERLRSDQNALAAPDEARLRDLQEQLAAAQEAASEADARLHELQEAVPQLDDDRRTRQQAVNTEGARHAELSARLEALKALQEKVKTDGKLAPWLAKHGLEGLQGLWSRIHIEQGWENALEAALRERLGALEVSRLDMVRAFGSDAPPAKLAFYTPAGRRRAAGPERAAATGRPAAPGRCRPAGLAGRLAARLPTRRRRSKTRWRSATSCSPARRSTSRAAMRSPPTASASTPRIPSRPACWRASRRWRTSSASCAPRR